MPKIQTIKTDRFEMDYFSFGQGQRAFIIIPGVSMKPITLSAEAIESGFELFARHYRVYVFDRKKDIRAGYSISEMAEDTAQAMQLLGIRDAHVFGASQGGMIAQEIAVNHPELVGKLYLASTMSRPGEIARQTMEEWIELTKAGNVQALNHGIFTKIYSEEYYASFRSIFEAMESDGTPEEVERFRILVEACLGFDVYDRLGQIRCPVYVVASRCDRVLGWEASVEIGEKLGCEVRLYDGYSHAVYDEAPDFRPRMLEALLK